MKIGSSSFFATKKKRGGNFVVQHGKTIVSYITNDVAES